jgi:fructan beta-fructosidase
VETYRPEYHFSPTAGWLNDPNGLIWHEGEYHLFYQWYPTVDVDIAGMCWGHAVAGDLVHWTHLDVALRPDALGAIWSGSAVVDRADTSGLFGGKGGLVAAFTHRSASDAQRQGIAYSNDRGRTWMKYAGNPVLGDDASREFRDPKVFWHQPTRRWVMVVGVEHQVFASPNLRDWTLLGKTGFSSECPDLFPLPVEGEDEVLWVLSLAGRQVVVGAFDGRTFTPQTGPIEVDGGPDFYAAQSWENVPGGRRVWIGWLNNWRYARQVPDFGARGFLSVPRELSLRRVAGRGLVLVQRPVPELQVSRTGCERIDPRDIRPGRPLAAGDALEIRATIRPGANDRCGFKVAVGEDQETLVGYDAAADRAFVDRERSGLAVTRGRFDAQVALRNGLVDMQIFVDRCSTEAFFGDGEAVISTQIYPAGPGRAVEWFSENGRSGVEEMRVDRVEAGKQ